MRAAAFAVLLLALPAAAAAQTPPSAPKLDSQRLADMPAGTYGLDKAHASLTAKVRHLGLSDYTLRFRGLDGSFTYDPARPQAAALRFTVDVASIDTGDPKFDEELRGAQFLGAEANRTATFTSTRITPPKAGDDDGQVQGSLSFRGVTRPVTLEVDWRGVKSGMRGETRTGFSGETTIRRSEWGFTHLVPAVGDEVHLLIEVEFVRQP